MFRSLASSRNAVSVPAQCVVPRAFLLYRAAFPARRAPVLFGESTATPQAPLECEFSLTEKRALAASALPDPLYRSPLVQPSSNARPAPPLTISPRLAWSSIPQQGRSRPRTRGRSALWTSRRGLSQVYAARLASISVLRIRHVRRSRRRPARTRARAEARLLRRTLDQKSAIQLEASRRFFRRERRSLARPPKIQ